ncbi:glycosyltransferase [Spirilliplanes yamanashiensis]|uniref:Glycosyltransferase 2-like domain-containing protein n=1 Tax=Spirilliplanes yamanashiensis TaxID=42233 RepID=A0A8J3Y383_9ACTN|nr:glycosyltransferase [Spirilliplanes yamanashiensis]MDP9814363.1 hypothetical protein [Spirilliplanes yamanashiensis]GIJ00654.1 hypothetical protein Sya03_00060 [Spirilliplanes yamanashiensis]
MSTQPLSVVVTAGGSADDFHALLESLRPGLGPRDEVVCLVPAGRDDLRRELTGHRWVRVLDDTTSDQGARWAAGLAATRHDIVALFDGDLILPGRWREPLVREFDDETVVAAGPHCYNSFGPQGGVELDDQVLSGVAVFKAYARQWWNDHRGQTTDMDRLGPVCVVVRRSALEAAGGPTLDMPYERLRELGRIVLVRSVLAAHGGGSQCGLRVPRPPGAPLLSAALIVKDEENALPASLTALNAVVDEVVVYDTGSTDRTREIAREHGATVVEGYWDDHFGDARNRGLAHCSGEWVLVVDADEVTVADADALRAALEESGESGHAVTVRTIEESGTYDFMGSRLFRGALARYSGRLHEQPLDLATGVMLVGSHLTELTVMHTGYSAATFAIKDKGDRNRRLAEKGVADQVLGPAGVVNLARSQVAAGDVESAVATAWEAMRTPQPQWAEVQLLSLAIRGEVQLQRLAEARRGLDRLREIATREVTVQNMEIHVLYGEKRFQEALDLMAVFPERARDDLNQVHGLSHLTSMQVGALRELGRPDEAADMLRAALRRGEFPLPLVGLAQVLEEGGSSVAEVAELMPQDRLRWLLHQAGRAEPQLAETLAEALFERYPGDSLVLGFVAWLGDRLPLMRALEWSARQRAHGFADRCPLLAIARQPDRSVGDRVLAAAMAHETFGDPAAVPLLVESLERVTAEDAGPVLERLRTLAPSVAAMMEPAAAR